jgi:predicted secreted protein
MRWTSMLAIYSLFWVMSAFLVLPFGVRTHDEEGVTKIPGQADSAPANFQPKKIAMRATMLSVVLFGLFVLNYLNGWITPQDLDITGGPPDFSAKPQG